MKNQKLFVSLLVFLVVSACLSGSPMESPQPTKKPASTISAAKGTDAIQPTSAPLPAEHHIAIRVVNGVGEFYHRVTGQKFIPRGMNYVRLAWQTKDDGSQIFGHSLFDPGKYNSLEAAGDLTKMHADGYNVARVFLSPDIMGTKTGGLSPQYVKNVADFLKIAQTNQIYVIFTLDWLPGGKYGEILNRDCCETFALMNANFLPPAGLEANQVFYQDFIRDLFALNAPIEYVFSWQLRNEMFYDSDQPPLSFNSGKVTTANGKTYDMSSKETKRMMVEENNVFWLDRMREAILEVDPTALVSAGFFWPQEPNPSRIGDPRLAVTEPAIWESKLDFIDLHAYPGGELNLKQYVENFRIKDMKEKPIVMGEFGANVYEFSSIFAAAQVLMDWQIESCKYGFDGWLFWTWDLDEQPDFFNALMQDGAINGVLAPVLRQNPCVQ